MVRSKGFEFEWDPAKARANLRKHGVSFEEAMSAFADPLGLFFPESGHRDRRFVLLAMTRQERLLYMVHAERESDVIRIISARLATRRERRRYEHGE